MRILKGQKADEIDHLAELCEVLDAVLNLLQSVANSICLMHDFVERVAHGALVKKVVGHIGVGLQLEAALAEYFCTSGSSRSLVARWIAEWLGARL